MRKLLLFSFILSFTAAWMIGCGTSSKPVPQVTKFAFMQEAPSAGPILFSPMAGKFTATSNSLQFTSSTVTDPTTNMPIVAEIYSIALSPDGKKAVLDLYGGMDGMSTQWDIWVANSDGSGTPLQITNDTNNNHMPQFSPDGSKVIFTSYRPSGEGNSYSMVIRNVRGSGNEVVLASPAGQYASWAPTFSPDGTKIAVEIWGYNSSTDTDYDGIWVMNADGSHATMLTNPGVTAGCHCYDETPAFTMDGTKIVFTRDDWTNNPEVENIFIMNVDGTGVTQLTHDSGINFDPFTINIGNVGQKILFGSNRDNLTVTGSTGFELYSMNLDGSSITRLTNDALYDAFSGEWYQSGDASNAAARHVQARQPQPSQGHIHGLKVNW